MTENQYTRLLSNTARLLESNSFLIKWLNETGVVERLSEVKRLSDKYKKSAEELHYASYESTQEFDLLNKLVGSYEDLNEACDNLNIKATYTKLRRINNGELFIYRIPPENIKFIDIVYFKYQNINITSIL